MAHIAYVVVGLSFGDEGKGTIVDSLVRQHEAKLVCRFSGGAQAAHTVISPDGKKHTFSQFGSGTLVPGVKTFLSEYMLIEPPAMYFEEKRLRSLGITDAVDRLVVSPECVVVTPYHVISNRLLEAIRSQKHGSCGRGIGATVKDTLDHPEETLRVKDLVNPATLEGKMRFFRDKYRRELEVFADIIEDIASSPSYLHKEIENLYSNEEYDATLEVYHEIGTAFTLAEPDFLEKHLSSDGVTVFEGAQGILLDEDWGFHPHNTWSKTTSHNALALIAKAGVEDVNVRRIGVTRAYSTRHGAGPFPTENADLVRYFRDESNPENTWQGSFRYGWLDASLVKYAIEANGGIEELAITCLDQMANLPEDSPWRIGLDYEIEDDDWSLEYDPSSTYWMQELVGRTLETAIPYYMDDAPRNMEEYGWFVSRLLGVPLTITSTGPNATDKQFYAHPRDFRRPTKRSTLVRCKPQDYSRRGRWRHLGE
jgi:adenylosuccinate synthase